jgi:hypothetical protein
MMEGVNSNMIYLIYCKNICKCHNVPHPAQQLKKKKRTLHMSLEKNRAPAMVSHGGEEYMGRGSKYIIYFIYIVYYIYNIA